MAIVLILKFRTSIVSFLLFTFLKYYKNKHFYLFLFTLLVIVEATMGISSIIFKWGEGVSVGGSRTEIWMYYLNFMIDNFPNSLLPYIFTEFDSHKPVYHYLSNETGAYHTIHNLFIDLFYRLGIVFGVVAILLLLLPVIFVKKNKLERNLYIALLIFGMLEPSLGFATNLISLFFYVMLFYLYLNIKFTWRSKFEKNINNNN